MSSIRSVVRIAVVAAAVIAPAAAHAQELGRSATRVRPAVITQEDIVAAEARGEGYAISGQFAEARAAYREAVTLRVRVKESPAAAQWQIANLYFGEGDMLRAAQTLDKLAFDADRRGEHDVRAEALLEAAFLYRSAGQRRRAADIARELRSMRAEKPLSQDIQDEIARRIG